MHAEVVGVARREVSQRGGVGLYLLFSIVISIAAGYGVYHFMKQHPDAFASPNKSDDESATSKPGKSSATNPSVPAPTPTPPVEEAIPVPEPAVDPMAAAMTLAESNAENPTPSDADVSPVFGTAGISGGIERGAVERRFKPRAAILQRCFERSSSEPGVLRVSMEVTRDGKVSKLTLSPGWDDGFQACVTSALNFTFSATKDGNPAAVVQPIAFR
jgi:hypothetical protein